MKKSITKGAIIEVAALLSTVILISILGPRPPLDEFSLPYDIHGLFVILVLPGYILYKGLSKLEGGVKQTWWWLIMSFTLTFTAIVIGNISNYYYSFDHYWLWQTFSFTGLSSSVIYQVVLNVITIPVTVLIALAVYEIMTTTARRIITNQN